MVKMSSSVCQRIRRVKNSLENAEQSFLDNKDMRGELDLMLAEAELSNLRKKRYSVVLESADAGFMCCYCCSGILFWRMVLCAAQFKIDVCYYIWQCF